MQCGACGSQDTTYKKGISKSGKNAGQPWEAYDCNEPQCKNEKGYPSRTFVPRKKSPTGVSTGVSSGNELATINKKLDILLQLAGYKPKKTEVIERDEIGDLGEEAPF